MSRSKPSRSTRAQREQQQIAWVMYVTEGSIANLHACEDNALPILRRQELRVAVAEARAALADLRVVCDRLHSTIDK